MESEEDKVSEENKVSIVTKVYSWGNGNGGNLGNGKEDYEPLPYNIKQLNGKQIVKVECGEWYCCALTASGTLYGWGKSSRFRFGLKGEGDVVYLPTKIPIKFKVKDFSSGYWHSIILSESSEVYTWGDNKKGALGLGHFDSITEFTKIPDFNNITKVKAGCGYSLFINSDGNLFSCGRNEVNGLNSKKNISIPTQITSISENVVYIDCGVDHAAAVTDDGKLYTWGANVNGQLGYGSSFSKSKIQYSPKIVSSLEDVHIINVSCSKGLKHWHTAWVDDNGGAYFWGWGYKGKLGNVENWNHERDWDEDEPK